ncbi:MAG: hypothetical protein ABW061_00615 [Polyangiaceae bacterium]
MGRSIGWAALVGFVSLAHPGVVLAADAPAAPGPAEPGPAEPAEHSVDKADETFDAGRALLKDKRYADACPKFEESQRQDPASGTLLALAYCQELSSLLATSRATYLAAARLAEREGHRDRQAAAMEHAQALASRVSRITVIVPHELLVLPGFHLLRDGIEFERASFGIAVATDGGSHAFEASAPGRVPWTSTVTLFAEGDQKSLVLPVLDQVQQVDAAAAARRSPPLLAQTPEDRSKVTLERVSLGLAAASFVGLAVGTGFALHANAKNNDSNANGCTPDGCSARGSELRNDALTAARVSTWAFVAGGAFAVASVALYVHANTGSSGVAKATASLRASVALSGLQLRGDF